MINLLISILLIASIFGTGSFFLNFFLNSKKSISILLFLPLAFSLGLTTHMSLLYFGYFLGFLAFMQLVVPVLGLLLLVYSIVNPVLKAKVIIEKYDLYIVGGIFIVLLVQSLATQYFPILENDARAIWTLKAKLLYYGKDTFNAYLANPTYSYSHQDYPIGLPLLWSSFFKILNGVYEPVVSIFSHALFWQFPLLFLGILKRKYNIDNFIATSLALIIFLPLAVNVVKWSGYADYGLSFIFASTITAFILFSENRKNSWLSLGLLFASSALFIKNEGIPWFIISILLITALQIIKKRILSKDRISNKSFVFLIPLIISAVWMYIKRSMSIENDLAAAPNLSITSYLQRLEPIYKEVMVRLLNGSTLGILWPLILVGFILLFLVNWKQIISRKMLPALLLVAQFGSYIAVYLITPHDINWHISTSFSRLLIHIIPGIIIFVTYNIKDLSFSLKEKK